MSWISMATGFERPSSFKRSSPPARRNIFSQRHTHTDTHKVRDAVWEECCMCLIWMVKMTECTCLCTRQHEEHMRRRQRANSEEKLPAMGNPTEAPDSCCVLHHSHNPSVLFNSRLLSVIMHRSGFVVLFLSPLYFPLISFCTHSGIQEHTHMHTHTHRHLKEEMRTSPGTGAGVSRWKEANLWLDDWVIEKVKGQSCKAVSLSTSLTQTRTNAETQEQQPDPESGAPELASSFKRTVVIINSVVFMRWGWQKDGESWQIHYITLYYTLYSSLLRYEKSKINTSENCLLCDD